MAPEDWKEKKQLEATLTESKVEDKESAAGTKEQRSTWARLIKKVYDMDPLVCPRYGGDKKIIAII